MVDYRRLSPNLFECRDIYLYLVKAQPHIHKGNIILSDSTEAMFGIFQICVDEQRSEIQKKYKAFCKKNKVKKEKREKLNDQQALLKSMIYKSFGFRTLVTTGCLNCKSVSRKVEYNLSYDISLQQNKKVMSAQRASELMKEDEDEDSGSLLWKMFGQCFRHSAKVQKKYIIGEGVGKNKKDHFNGDRVQ